MTVSELADKMESLRESIVDQRVLCAECSTSVKSAMENLNQEVAILTRSITDDNGERSIHSRLAVIENKVERIEKANQLRIAHIITLFVALIGSGTAIAIAFFK